MPCDSSGTTSVSGSTPALRSARTQPIDSSKATSSSASPWMSSSAAVLAEACAAGLLSCASCSRACTLAAHAGPARCGSGPVVRPRQLCGSGGCTSRW